jgi:hypothetical protein
MALMSGVSGVSGVSNVGPGTRFPAYPSVTSPSGIPTRGEEYRYGGFPRLGGRA